MGQEERKLIDDPAHLAAVLRRPHLSRSDRWGLTGTASTFVDMRRYDDALQVFDVLLDCKNLALPIYCTALWIVQQGNTGLPKNSQRARRYLERCLPHAPFNPPIYLTASAVLIELGDHDAAIDQLIQAARRGISPTDRIHTLSCDVDLDAHLGKALLQPLRHHPRWAELQQAVAPPLTRFEDLLKRAGAARVPPMPDPFAQNETPDPRRWGQHVSPRVAAKALVLALDDGDARVRQCAANMALTWQVETGEDAMGSPAPPWMQDWYRTIGSRIATCIPLEKLADVAVQDLHGPYRHRAAATLMHLARFASSYDRATQQLLEQLAPPMHRCLTDGDALLRTQIADVVRHLTDSTAIEVLARQLIPTLLAMVEELAGEGRLSDFEQWRVVQLESILGVLDCIDPDTIGPATRRALARLLDSSEGVHLRRDLVKWAADLREQSAAACIEGIVKAGHPADAYLEALDAIGWLDRAGAAPMLAEAIQAPKDDWHHDAYASCVEVMAALSLLQLGHLDPTGRVLRWLAHIADGRLDRTDERMLEKLADAGARFAGSARAAEVWQVMGPAVTGALSTLVQAMTTRHWNADVAVSCLAPWHALERIATVKGAS